MAKDHSEHSMIKKAVLQEAPIAGHSEKEKTARCFLAVNHFLKNVRQLLL